MTIFPRLLSGPNKATSPSSLRTSVKAMLNALRATVTLAGAIVFGKALALADPTSVLVGLFQEPVVASHDAAADPLSWSLSPSR